MNSKLSVFMGNNLLMLCTVLFLIFAVNVSWVSDDALITMRHVLNFINGYGPVFNVGERVQAYTHPLWFLLISLFSCFFNYVYVTFGLSFLFSFLSVYVLFKFIKNVSVSNINFKLTVACFLVIFSKAFIDFSSSGLENPLSHFLLLLFFALYFSFYAELQKKSAYSNKIIYLLVFVSCLIYLTRMDHIIMIVPSLIGLLINLHNSSYGYKNYAKLIVFPLVLMGGWHLFSLVYYGFLFPNTAYAKLGTGILQEDYLLQGFTYFYYTLKTDPVTILVIILALFSAIEQKDNLLPSFGVFLYSVYILKIGGDFMVGRFYSAPFIVSLLLIMRLEYKQCLVSRKIFLVVTLGVLSLNTFNKNILNSREYIEEASGSFYHGIADERAFYAVRGLGFYNLFERSIAFENLIRAYDFWKYDSNKSNFKTLNAIGYSSIVLGPSTYVFDKWALSEPLLAKLPAISKVNFRIGHFYRSIPSGYIKTLLTGNNFISDKNIALYYAKLKNLIRGDLFSTSRFWDIVDLNLNPLVKNESNEILVNGSDYADVDISDGAPWHDEHCITFNNGQSVVFFFEEPQVFNSIDVTVDSNDAYEIQINGESYGIAPVSNYSNGVYTKRLNFEHAFENVRKINVKAKGGDDLNSICRIVINHTVE